MTTKSTAKATLPKIVKFERGDLLVNNQGTIIMYTEETALGLSGVVLLPSPACMYKIGEKQDSFSHNYWTRFTGSVTLTSE